MVSVGSNTRCVHPVVHEDRSQPGRHADSADRAPGLRLLKLPAPHAASNADGPAVPPHDSGDRRQPVGANGRLVSHPFQLQMHHLTDRGLVVGEQDF